MPPAPYTTCQNPCTPANIPPTDVVIDAEPAPGPRPDFARRLVGGVWLDNVFMSFRGKTDRSALVDCNLQVDDAVRVQGIGCRTG